MPDGGGWRVSVGERTFEVQAYERDRLYVEIDGLRELVHCAWERVGPALHVELDGQAVRFEAVVPGAGEEDAAGDGTIAAPMSGRVLGVHVAVGDAVEASTKVVTLEAMKLETALRAGVAGTVAEVRASEGAQVQGGQVLVIIEPDAEDEE